MSVLEGLLIRQDRDKLGTIHDRFLKGEIESYVVVSVAQDGTTQVDFDCGDIRDENTRPRLNKLGGGLRAAHEHLVQVAMEVERRDRIDHAMKAGKKPN